jgi:hypothetical protein
MIDARHLWLLVFATLFIIMIAGYMLSVRKQRSPAEKISNAIHELSQSVDNAQRRRDGDMPDQTPASNAGAADAQHRNQT